MKKTTTATLTALALGLAALTTFAQETPERPRRPGGPDGAPGRGPGGPGEPGGPGREGFRPPMPPLMQALDANQDGVIDAAEINNAVAALKKLDKNGDGRLSQDELRPEGGFGGRGSFGGPGGSGGPGGPGAGPGGPGGGGDFATRLMGFDKNSDGKITKDELPEQMQRIMERGDTNGDGALDKAEIDAMVARFPQGGGRPGGPGQKSDGQGRPGKQRPPSE